jgi:hypothetical protein
MSFSYLHAYTLPRESMAPNICPFESSSWTMTQDYWNLAPRRCRQRLMIEVRAFPRYIRHDCWFCSPP